jgi:hypothetical protein
MIMRGSVDPILDPLIFFDQVTEGGSDGEYERIY